MSVLIPPTVVTMVNHVLEARMFDAVTVYGPDAEGNFTVQLLPTFNGRLKFRSSDETDGTGNQLGSVDVASATLYYPLSVDLPVGQWQAMIGGVRYSHRQNSRGTTMVEGTAIQQYLELQFVGPQS